MAFTTDTVWFVRITDGVFVYGTLNVIIHPVADTLPTVTIPAISFPTIVGVVPQEERTGVKFVDEAVEMCPLAVNL